MGFVPFVASQMKTLNRSTIRCFMWHMHKVTSSSPQTVCLMILPPYEQRCLTQVYFKDFWKTHLQLLVKSHPVPHCRRIIVIVYCSKITSRVLNCLKDCYVYCDISCLELESTFIRCRSFTAVKPDVRKSHK